MSIQGQGMGDEQPVFFPLSVESLTVPPMARCRVKRLENLRCQGRAVGATGNQISCR